MVVELNGQQVRVGANQLAQNPGLAAHVMQQMSSHQGSGGGGGGRGK